MSMGNKSSQTSIGKLRSNATANVEGEWFINKDLDLAYISVLASDSVPSDTSTDVDSDPWSAMIALTSLHAPVKSSLLVCEKLKAHMTPSLKYQPGKKANYIQANRNGARSL